MKLCLFYSGNPQLESGRIRIFEVIKKTEKTPALREGGEKNINTGA